MGLFLGLYLNKSTKVSYIPINKEIRDSLYIVNDSIRTKVIYLTKKYNEKRDSILNNDSSADMQFFSNYIDSYQRANKNR